RVGAARPAPPAEEPSLSTLMLFFTDRDRFWRWQNASIDAAEWREDDKRNFFGIAPNLVIPTAAATVAVLVLYWPADGDLTKFAQRIGPGAIVDMAREANSGPFCSGPSYPDGKCPGN